MLPYVMLSFVCAFPLFPYHHLRYRHHMTKPIAALERSGGDWYKGAYLRASSCWVDLGSACGGGGAMERSYGGERYGV